MNEIFDLTTLLLLAVAVLIFVRLRSVLGRRTGNERPRFDPVGAPERSGARGDFDNVINLPRGDARGPSVPPSAPRDLAERLSGIPEDSRARQPLADIAKADPRFDVPGFLNGAKAAYEMIVTAYAHGELDVLRGLLSREVYDSFDHVISDRERRGETTDFSLVGILSSDIIDASLAGRIANVTVQFVSELVTAVRDRNGVVVEGDERAVRRVTDIWTFSRDTTSPNPNWRLVATDTA